MSLEGIIGTFTNVQFNDVQKVRLFANKEQSRQSEHILIEQFDKIVASISQLQSLIRLAMYHIIYELCRTVKMHGAELSYVENDTLNL